MKKKLILNSVAVLVLIFGIGGCDTASADDMDNDTTNSSQTQDKDLTKEDAASPSELMDKAYLMGNYSITMVVDEWVSDKLSYYDYYMGNYDFETLYASVVCTEYILNAYYTEDAIMVHEAVMEDGSEIYYGTFILINDYDRLYGNIMYEYDSYNYGNGFSLYDFYSGHWQDNYFSLFDIKTKGHIVRESDFVLIEEGYTQYDDYVQVYNYANDESVDKVSSVVGTDLWRGSFIGYLQPIDYAYFYPDYQELNVSFVAADLFYTDYTYTYMELIEDDFFVNINSVGEIDISDYVKRALAD